MSHPVYDVVEFTQIGPHSLLVSFDDGSEQLIDFSPVLFGELYGPLRDPAVFSQVRLDPELRNLVWPNGADFDPYVLHEWPRAVKQLAQRLHQASAERSAVPVS